MLRQRGEPEACYSVPAFSLQYDVEDRNADLLLLKRPHKIKALSETQQSPCLATQHAACRTVSLRSRDERARPTVCASQS
jgi:hypothetical protein